MAHLNNHIISFIKISLITTLLFGGLIAQSYATNVISDSLFVEHQDAVKTQSNEIKMYSTVIIIRE